MINARRITGGTLILLTAVFCTSDLLAQFPGGTRSDNRGRGDSGRGTVQAPRPPNSGDTVELIEFRLGMLEEDLKLSPAQLKAWEPYAERVRDIAEDISRERVPAQSLAQPTAMQQMNRAVDRVRNRLTALEDVATSAKALYEILGPEQKMLVDARFPTIVPLIAGVPQSVPSAPADRSGQPSGAFGGRPRDVRRD
jgi:hypothetical protein